MSFKETPTVLHHGNRLRVNFALTISSAVTTSYRTVVGAFTIFVFLATAFHYYVLQQEKTSGGSVLKEAILCFSVIRTVGKFLTTKSSELNLECICGIRFISMIFIISGHTFLFMVGGPVQNVDFYDKVIRSILKISSKLVNFRKAETLLTQFLSTARF